MERNYGNHKITLEEKSDQYECKLFFKGLLLLTAHTLKNDLTPDEAMDSFIRAVVKKEIKQEQ